MDKKIYLEYLTFMGLKDNFTSDDIQRVYHEKMNKYQEEDFFDIENILYLNKAKNYLQMFIKEEIIVYNSDREENYKIFYELYKIFEEKLESNKSLFTTDEKKNFMNKTLEISKLINENKFKIEDMLRSEECSVGKEC